MADVTQIEDITAKFDNAQKVEFTRNIPDNEKLSMQEVNVIVEEIKSIKTKTSDASESTKGIAKLYSNLSQNIDGAPTVKAVQDAINAINVSPVIATNFKGIATPSGTPTGIDDGYWNAITAGTYINYGGVVVPANNVGVIARVSGAFTISTVVLAVPAISSVVNTTNTTETVNGKAVADFTSEQLEFEPTYNFLNTRIVQTNKIIHASGSLNTGTYTLTPYIPIVAGEAYRIIGKSRPILNVAFYTSAKVFITPLVQVTDTSPIFTAPANAAFIVYYLNVDFSDAMLVKGSVIKPYIAFGTPKNTKFLASKQDFWLQSEFNQNPNFYNYKTDSSFIRTATSTKLVINPNQTLLNYGFERIAKFNSGASTQIAVGIQKIFSTSENLANRYLYYTCLIYTTNSAYIPNPITSAVYLKDTANTQRTATILQKNFTQVSTGVWKLDMICLLPNYSANELFVAFRDATNQDTTAADYYITDIAFGWNDNFIDNYTFVKNKITNAAIISSNKVLGRFYEKTAQQQEFKKWCLYGTSIEDGDYFDAVAEHFNANYTNYGSSGAGILWDNTKSVYDSITTVLPQKAWSCTWAEKQAYLAANSLTVTGASEIDCFDQNLLGNLDADIFFIGTFGINDRGNPANFVIDKVNKKYDRKTIYGAYNHILRELFQLKPTAKVIIFGQHTRFWSDTDLVNEIQREVAKDWCIPFLDWGKDLGFSTEIITIGGVTKTLVQHQFNSTDGSHPNAYGKSRMADYLIRRLPQYV